MMQFADRREVIVRVRKKNHRPKPIPEWMEDWFWSGTYDKCSGPHPDVEFCALYLHRMLHALRSMSDGQYVEMRNRRHVHDRELEDSEIDGVRVSARSDRIHWARRSLKDLHGRLAHVVNALPNRAGFAADQDHFELRSCKPTWWVSWRFASYVPLDKRLALYKEMSRIERCHKERYQKERENARRAEKYPELLRRIRELEALSKLA